jgi:hypothetical protein
MIADKNRVLFLDIETAPLIDTSKQELPNWMRGAWTDKIKSMNLEVEKNELMENYKFNNLDLERYPEAKQETDLINLTYSNRAALYPEFAQVVCISVGIINGGRLQQHCFYQENKDGNNEETLLQEFKAFLSFSYKANGMEYAHDYLCAYYGKNFDFPFIIKRMIINNMKLPKEFSVNGMKPWEITQFIDPYDTWKFGGKDSSGLRAVYGAIFNKDCKDDINGAQVAELWFHDPEANKDKIVNYCNNDVGVLCNLFWRLNELV